MMMSEHAVFKGRYIKKRIVYMYILYILLFFVIPGVGSTMIIRTPKKIIYVIFLWVPRGDKDSF